jgi:hypothetical protein
MPMVDVTPPRPMRADFEAPSPTPAPTTVTDVDYGADEETDVNSYTFVNGDGEETTGLDAAAWGNLLYQAFKDASSLQIAEGLWETNSPQLQRYRMETSPKQADHIEDAYGEALKRHPRIPQAPAAEQDPKEEPQQKNAAEPQKDDRPHAPKHLGKYPRNTANGFDHVKAANQLGDAIEKSDTLDDVRSWQNIHMNWLDSIQKHAPEAYDSLQARIQAMSQLLEGAEK